MLLDALRHTDGSRRTDESTEVTTYTLATHQSWHTTDAVKLQSLMTTIATRHDATATAYTHVLVKLGIDNGVTIQHIGLFALLQTLAE